MNTIRNYTATLYIVLISILYYILCYLSPIALCDDIIYKFLWVTDNESFVKPISSIKDIFLSQYIHYHVLNGRSIVHFILQLFDGILGKDLCNIMSGFIFGWLVYMVSNYITQKRNCIFSYSLITLMLFVCMPGFHNEFLLFVGVFNYLWVSAATILFLSLMDKYGKMQNNKKSLPLSMFAFFAGWLHEGISVPISLTLITYCIIHRKNILKSTFLYCSLFYIIGTCMCVMAPGTLHRIGQDSGIMQALTEKIFLGCVNLLHLRISYLMLIVSLLTFLKKRDLWDEHFDKYRYFYLTWIFTFIPVFGSGATETRVVYYTEFIAMMIIANIIILLYQQRYKRMMTVFANLIMFPLYCVVLHYSYKNHQNALSIEHQLNEAKTSVIEVAQIRPIDNYVLSEIFDSYVREPIKFGPFENAQGFVQDNSHVKCMKILYGKSQLYFIPQDILYKIKENQIKYNKFIYNKNKEMIVTQIQPTCTPKDVKLLLNKEDIASLPFYKRKLAYKSDLYEIQKGYYDTLHYANRKYLLICCPTRNISRRISTLVYKCTPHKQQKEI